ncbi:calcium/calmodulin-dependent 3',5'-cyclic nucleotide phosphodiesterase 1A [Teleopsis dalmanni]|uniref:calcium/calmodulin-dependent 3',5'-cyclic nucleotide phosphodiesterase 1A n=1 Tax=Teleopsis dalmanni TaxID=139649 RepID=UPI0018CDB410|nr:calcium/calmodulin-dependent 3',5'-cyclic nucleotide phosphodiesterase 1A [Teleopsis dalmanni]
MSFASSPESLPKREEATSAGISCGNTTGIGATTSTGSTTDRRTAASAGGTINSSGGGTSVANSPNEVTKSKGLTFDSEGSNTILGSGSSPNGQVAKHGSLTIVRRSNSRKNFTQLDAQQTNILTSPSSTTATFLQQTTILGDTHPNNTNKVTATVTTTSATVSNTIYALNDNRTKDFINLKDNITNTITDTTTNLASTSYRTDVLQEGVQKQPQQLKQFSVMEQQPSKMLPSSPGGRASGSGNSLSDLNTIRSASDEHTFDDQDSNINVSSVELATENLPAVDTPDACDKAAVRLRCLLRLLNTGQISNEVLQRNLHYAARVLEAVFLDEAKSPSAGKTKLGQKSSSSVEREERLADEDDELSEVQPDAVPPEVREWLASTFTRQLATTRRKTDEKPKFRSVAHAIRAGIFVDRIYRRVSSTALMQFPPDVVRCLRNLDDWSFDVFSLAEAANGQPVKFIGYDLLNRYGIIHKFKIAPNTLETFLNRIEEGYCRYRNPYHNNLHAADVTQTVHHMLCQTGLMNWLTDLEIFATLLAALIHDYEHTGTTNNFHVMSGSETALLYNDRAVLENHHISAAFRVLRDDECNILSNLSREEYRELRTLIIDMVLSTDMSFHFQQLKNMRNLLTLNEATVDKSKALSLVLHCCDISHPAKRWNLHHRWTMLLLEEFFRQGDLERELGLPFSPLCDRNNTLVAESQIGFIDFIVDPSMSVMADMLEYVLTPIAPMCKNVNASIDAGDVPVDEPKPIRSGSNCNAILEGVESKNEENGSSASNTSSSSAAVASTSNASAKLKFSIHKPWLSCLSENKAIWKEQALKDAEARSFVTAIEETESKDGADAAGKDEAAQPKDAEEAS